MELFYSENIQDGTCTLNEEESRHCTKVLRHTAGDIINVIDGKGGMYQCKILGTGREIVCEVISKEENFGGHNYNLIMAVAPTKNIDRYEWFLEKATEIGIDCVVPVIGEHSERKIIKPERLCKIIVSAAKQSLKGAIPFIGRAESVSSFIQSTAKEESVLKLIAYCGSIEKISLAQALSNIQNNTFPQIQILIGPEGDFSPKEVELALENGFKPVHLGNSRLRTETAAIAAVSGVYFMLK